MHRRVLSFAHNADFEEIEDIKIRAPLEARNLIMGRELVLKRKSIRIVKELTTMAYRYNSEKHL